MALAGYLTAAAADESGAEWSGETNVFTSNDTYASYNSTTQSFLRITTLGFAVPYNAIIRGIEVRIEGNADGGTAAERTIEVDITKNGTAGVGTSKTLELNLTTDTVQVLGGAADLWGTAFDIDEVNATTFGCRIRKNTATANNIDVDHVVIRLYYDWGIRGEWDVNYDGFAEFSRPIITQINGYLDYDGGSGGTAPAVGDVIRDQTTGATKRILLLSEDSVLAFGTAALGDEHENTSTAASIPAFGDNNVIDILDYVDFDTETGGGVSESDIGRTMSGGTLSGAVVRHVESDGSIGRIWFTTSSGSLADTNAIAIPDGGSTVATANGASVSNAWTGAVNGTLIETAQGYLDYDAESTSFEGASGSERIRSSNFQHNMCVLDTTSDATAMLVDDREDPNATTTGRMFLIDISGTFANNNTIIALEEVDFDAEQNGGFAVGDNVGDAASPTHDWFVRRLIDNGDGTGTLYLERNGGSARFANNDAIWVVSSTQRGTANGAQRERVGSATIDGTLTTADVQWLFSHLYTDVQDQIDELANMDDAVPLTAQVRDQQYTATNLWRTSHFSTRRLKSGSVKQIDTLGSADDDTIYTSYKSVGSQAANLDTTAPQFYPEQLTNAGVFSFWDAGPINLLLRNKEDNVRIDNGKVTWFAREWGTLFDFFETSQVGGEAVIPLATGSDTNNQTTRTTVAADATQTRIWLAFASYTINFDTGSGTIAVGDVVLNTTTNQAGMVVRIPDSVASGTDLHLASDGADYSGWGDGETLDLLDRIDFDGVQTDADGNPLIFAVGDAIDNGGAKSGTVRFVRQYGATRGSIWISTGDTWVNDETIEVGATTYATADGAQVVANTWTALTNTATPETADNTVLKDIGFGSDNPYNGVIVANGSGTQATASQIYEWMKFATDSLAGSPAEAGTVLYPNNTGVQGRFYRTADSAYGAADLNKQSPIGAKAGTKLFLARGWFVEGIAAADVQNWETIDSDGTQRVPPNFQNLVVDGVVIGDSISSYRRWTESPSGTTDFNVTVNTIVIDTGGDFDGIEVGAKLTVSGSVSNNGVFTVQSKDSSTQITVEEALVDEQNVSSVVMISDNIDREALTDGTGNNSGDGDYVVTETIPTDYPASGTLVVQDKNGSELYEDFLTYTSFTGSTFTLSGTLPRTYGTEAVARVPLMLKVATATQESQQIIYSADFPIKTTVRNGTTSGEKIIPSTVDGTFTSTGVTVAAVRTPDTIVE
jgi:hypothetical protein